MFEAGLAREVAYQVLALLVVIDSSLFFVLYIVITDKYIYQVVNRIQKLRKKAGLEPTDLVEVFIKPHNADKESLEKILNSQVYKINNLISSPVKPHNTGVTMVNNEMLFIAKENMIYFGCLPVLEEGCLGVFVSVWNGQRIGVL